MGLQLLNVDLQVVQHLQVHLQQKAMGLSEVAVQRQARLVALYAHSSPSQLGQDLEVGLPKRS